MAVPGYKGYKTNGEKFAGADFTVSIEALIRNKKALQIATSHLLGQNFAKAFEISFLDENNQSQFVWQTSWGFSTRSLGGMIAVHGDEKGLVLPPKMAPIQVVIVPIFRNEEDRIVIGKYIAGIEEMFKNVGIRFKADWGTETPGWKFNQWELKGVPLRLEIGKREAEGNQITCTTRLGKKVTFAYVPEVYKQIQLLLDEIHAEMLQKAEIFLHENTVDVASESELVAAMESGKAMFRVFFKDDTDKAKELQEKYKITPRVIPFETMDQRGPDFITGEEGVPTIFAKAY